LIHIAIEGCGVEKIKTLIVGEEGISAFLEKQINDIVMAFLCSPEDRGSYSISAFGVDVSPFFDEEVAKSKVVIDGGPLSQNKSAMLP